MLKEIIEKIEEKFEETAYRKLLKKYGVPTASMLSAKDRKKFEKELKELQKDESKDEDMINLGDFENQKHKKLLDEDSDYQKFFQKKLKSWGVKSPAELDKEKRKKFFSEVEKEWK